MRWVSGGHNEPVSPSLSFVCLFEGIGSAFLVDFVQVRVEGAAYSMAAASP